MSESQTINNLYFLDQTNRETFEKKLDTKSRNAELVKRVCSGEKSAFDEFYKVFAPLVHGIVLVRAPRQEVDDITQEVFISAFRNLHNLRDRTAVGAWIVRIARNRTTEFYRRSKVTEELPEEIAQKNMRDAEAGEILEVIRNLPGTYRETLSLRLIEGMTGQEIAEKTGLKASSVRVNLHRGMRILRERLGIEE